MFIIYKLSLVELLAKYLLYYFEDFQFHISKLPGSKVHMGNILNYWMQNFMP
jgi:hypothetical protein